MVKFTKMRGVWENRIEFGLDASFLDHVPCAVLAGNTDLLGSLRHVG